MTLKDVDLEEFRTIYQDVFKEEITLDQARDMAQRVIELYLHVARPLSEEGTNTEPATPPPSPPPPAPSSSPPA